MASKFEKQNPNRKLHHAIKLSNQILSMYLFIFKVIILDKTHKIKLIAVTRKLKVICSFLKAWDVVLIQIGSRSHVQNEKRDGGLNIALHLLGTSRPDSKLYYNLNKLL